MDGAGVNGVGRGGSDCDEGSCDGGIGGMYGLNITGAGWLNIEIWDGGIDGGDGGNEHPPATRIDVLMGPRHRGKPGSRGGGVVVVRGGGGGGERDRASDGMMIRRTRLAEGETSVVGCKQS